MLRRLRLFHLLGAPLVLSCWVALRAPCYREMKTTLGLPKNCNLIILPEWCMADMYANYIRKNSYLHASAVSGWESPMQRLLAFWTAWKWQTESWLFLYSHYKNYGAQEIFISEHAWRGRDPWTSDYDGKGLSAFFFLPQNGNITNHKSREKENKKTNFFVKQGGR